MPGRLPGKRRQRGGGRPVGVARAAGVAVPAKAVKVDSDYVVFIIDTSGSMKGIRERVMREIGNVLDIHPRVRGFQILNDNGAHLVRAWKGRWIPDTPQRRRSVLGVLRGWNAVSNSSPVEGLEVALRTYGRKSEKVSVYVFGDDYSGSSYDTVIETWTG